MTKQLSLTVALLLAAACKNEAPAPTTSSTPEAATQPARSAKIDVKPVRPPPPSLPAAGSAPADDQPGEEMHERSAHEDRMGRRRAMDTDGDGKISDEERAASVRERMTAMHARFDTDGDGKLSPKELTAARGRMRFDNPEALDTNHDGDISSDELAAGFKAKRDQWRANVNNNGGAAPPPAGQAPGETPAPADRTQ